MSNSPQPFWSLLKDHKQRFWTGTQALYSVYLEACLVIKKSQWKTWKLIHLYVSKDAEEGFGKGVTTEEAIDILIKSYGSSQIGNQVIKEVAKISASVSFMLHSSSQIQRLYDFIW